MTSQYVVNFLAAQIAKNAPLPEQMCLKRADVIPNRDTDKFTRLGEIIASDDNRLLQPSGWPLGGSSWTVGAGLQEPDRSKHV